MAWGVAVRYLSIKNLERYQHYKNRRPPWIKLHASLFDDYAFQCLQDASKLHLMLLWLLASQMDNRIPYDRAFISRKLGTTSPVDIEELVLQGFIELSQDDSNVLAPRKQMSIVETETETETETDSAIAEVKQDSTHAFDLAWASYPKRAGGNARKDALKAWEARRRSGVDSDVMHDGTLRYAAFCLATGKVGTEFVMQGARFYGPSQPFAEEWALPESAKPKIYSGSLSPEDFKRLSA